MITTHQLRKQFLQFFADKDHKIIPSSSLVPEGDKSLLFTNAGMVPFKTYFLGLEKPPHVRATSCQLCMRAGGKHNDLDNVGFTARHHTLFEMLGNFSFGEYFKQDAIHYGWEFLTVTLAIPAEKLLVTVYHDDQESYDIWQHDIGIPPEKIIRLGNESNFWQMGDTGPCGPCSEVFYDHGEAIFGGPPGSADEDGDRFVEIWNMVFMQYNRQEKNGALVPLPAPCVDTGMGLERMASVMQGVHDNYQTDVFMRLLEVICAIPRVRPASDSVDIESAQKVIADHIRASVFLLASRVLPDNEGRGYVLRRIIRRALRFGYMMGLEDGFFAPLARTVSEQMGDAYPEIVTNLDKFQATLAQEERGFTKTLASGINHLQQYFADNATGKRVDGDTLFTLYDTYGFPADLTEIIAKENNFTVDYAGYDKRMNEQKARSKQAATFLDVKNTIADDMLADTQTNFTGYAHLEDDKTTILQLFNQAGEQVQHLTDETGMLVLDTSPFYAESGGQIGDRGTIIGRNGTCSVVDVQKRTNAHIHSGTVAGTLAVGDEVGARVDKALRAQIAANHSATHLLHAALAQVLGDHVEQRGSLVSDTKLRFDFSHPTPLTDEQKQQIADYVNEQIAQAHDVQVEELGYNEAIQKGAKALFSEKYGDQVRVLTMGENKDNERPFSVELCGGTHVHNLGMIGHFLLLSESALAAGVRRIEALTGRAAVAQLAVAKETVHAAKSLLNAQSDEDLLRKIEQLLAENEQAKQQRTAEQKNTLRTDILKWQEQGKRINGVYLLVKQLEGLERSQVLDAIDVLKNACTPAVVLFFAEQNEKLGLFCGIDASLATSMSAKEIIDHIAKEMGGKGGGRNDMAQGGAPKSQDMNAVVAKYTQWIEAQVEQNT